MFSWSSSFDTRPLYQTSARSASGQCAQSRTSRSLDRAIQFLVSATPSRPRDALVSVDDSRQRSTRTPSASRPDAGTSRAPEDPSNALHAAVHLLVCDLQEDDSK